MYNNSHKDSEIISKYISFYVSQDWKQYMNEIKLRFESKWLMDWIDRMDKVYISNIYAICGCAMYKDITITIFITFRN